MDNRSPPTKLTTMAANQARIDADLIARTPVYAIEKYLESFASDGSLTFPVPQHILEALAARFRMFMACDPSVKSLNDAFGGKVGVQRKALLKAHKAGDIAFDVIVERRRLHDMPASERGPGTPHEIACELIAKRRKMSVDSVREYYKESDRTE